jgi:hypothetical protein
MQLLPSGITPDGFDKVAYEPLTAEQVEKHLGAPVAVGMQDGQENFRLAASG